jgi:hypothetical protein
MEYTREQLDAAFAADEVARLTVAAADMALRRPFRPVYGDLELSRGCEPAPVTVDDITDDDLSGAVAQLAIARGENYSQTWAQVRSLAGGEGDTGSLVAGIIKLARSDPGTAELAATISAEDRRALAAKGWALADGSYPIPDKSHLRAAAVLAASGHGNVEAARALIKKRAGELGVDLESLPGFGSSSGEEPEQEEGGENEKNVAAARRQRWARAGVVSLSAGDYDEVELAQSDAEGGPLEDIMRDHPEYFRRGNGGMQLPGETDLTQVKRPRSRRFRPARPGQVITRTRAHGEDEEDATDRRHPSRGGQVHPEVARYLRDMPLVLRTGWVVVPRITWVSPTVGRHLAGSGPGTWPRFRLSWAFPFLTDALLASPT